MTALDMQQRCDHVVFADGICLLSKAVRDGDTLRIPVAQDIISRLVNISTVKIASANLVTPSIQWRKDCINTLMPLIRVLQRRKLLDVAFALAVETHSKNGLFKVVNSWKTPGEPCRNLSSSLPFLHQKGIVLCTTSCTKASLASGKRLNYQSALHHALKMQQWP